MTMTITLTNNMVKNLMGCLTPDNSILRLNNYEVKKIGNRYYIFKNKEVLTQIQGTAKATEFLIKLLNTGEPQND